MHLDRERGAWHQLNCSSLDHCPPHQMKTVMISILDQMHQEPITQLLLNTKPSPNYLDE